MQNKPFRKIVAVTNAVTNMLNPPTLTGGVNVAETKTYIILTHIRALNKTAGGVTVTSYIGATGGSAAGTEFAFNSTTVPANSYLDWYGRIYMTTTDFLTAVAGALTSIVLELEGEIGVAD